jgi:hypothetical protein
MFNTIRHTPYTQPNGHGGFHYIAGGFQNQYGIETQIIASLCIAVDDPTNGRRVISVHDYGIGIEGS